jgi:glycosyltransferase involved in cell wall biosynthesis
MAKKRRNPSIKIKVTHIITMLELGGAQQNTLYTVSHLDPNKFQVQLLAGPGGILDPEARSLADKGINVGFISSLARPINPWKDALAIFQTWKALKTFKPDILHTHSSKAGIIGRIAGALAGVPVIIHTYHGFGFNNRQRPWVRAAFVGVEKWASHFTKTIIFVSEVNRREAQDLGIGRPEQHSVIRSGIKKLSSAASRDQRAEVRRGLGISEKAPLVTTIGPFKPQKNLSDFIKVAKLLHNLEPSSVFMIIGDGEQRPLLEKLRDLLGLDSCLIMTGWRADAQNLLSISDVFALTSLWEGLPRSLVEAMALGLPVVAYATDGVTDIIQDKQNGFLFNTGDTESMARQIHRLLKDESLRQMVGRKAESSIGEEFDIDHMVRQQEDLYMELARLWG